MCWQTRIISRGEPFANKTTIPCRGSSKSDAASTPISLIDPALKAAKRRDNI